ncbi:MAG: sialidase domain-containing protein, partial [Caldisericia bacterium]|nr:sialidase domain-containing protein [Caldisericia bacterium]
MSKDNISLIKKGIVLFFLIILIFIPNKPIMKEYLAVTSPVEDSKPLISKVVPVFHPGKPYKRVYSKAPPAPVKNKIFPKTSQQSDELVLTKNIYWKQITFTTDGYSSNIPNHLICFEMSTQSLIQEICEPFSEEQIYFTEQDGSTVIPHWIAFGFGKMETRIWLKIHPKPDKKKLTIFVCFGPGVTPNQNRLQNITPFDPSLTAYFCFDDLINSNLVDLSGNQVKGTMSSIDYGRYWHNFGSETYGLFNRDLIMFNDWQGWRYGDTKSVYMTSVMPASNDFSNQGSIEINMSLYTVSENITQVFFTDHNHQLVLGLTPDEKIFFQLGEDSNRITWDAKLEQATYHHVVITWDFPKKIIQLFVNGKPIKSLPSKTTFRFIQVHPVTSFLFGGIPGFRDKYGLSGFVEYVRIYHKPLNLAEVQQYKLINTKKNRFPYVFFGKLGIYKKGPEISKKINLNRPQQYPITENVKVNVIYSIPANSYYNFYYNDPDESYNSMDMTINTIDHLNEKPYPIFGFYSHFFQDIGT